MTEQQQQQQQQEVETPQQSGPDGLHVLLTGASGFVGSHVLDQLLSSPKNYIIHCAVRSPAKTEPWLNSRFPGVLGSRVILINVPDLTQAGAFDESVKDKDYIIHVATPVDLSVKNPRKELIEPAVKMVENLLLSAHKLSASGSLRLKRFVFTSSFAAAVNPLRGALKRNYTYTEADWQPITSPFLASFNILLSYLTSKTLAEKALWKFIETQKPAFDAVSLNPPNIYGPLIQSVPNEDSINGSNKGVWNLLSSGSVPPTDFTAWVDVRDVALLHVLALDNAKASNQRYIACAGHLTHQQLADEIHANPDKYPAELVSRVPKGIQGVLGLPKPLAAVDSSKVKRDFDFSFRDWKESAINGSMLSLLDIEKTWIK